MKQVPGTTTLVSHFHFFQEDPGKLLTRMSPFWILLELRMMDVVWQLEL